METYFCQKCGWLFPEEVEKGSCVKCGAAAEVGRTEKMSKSTKNVVDPEKLIEKYGADTARLFCLFAAPPERDLEWSDRGVDGSYRFLQRVWRLATENAELLQRARPVDWQQSDERDVRELRRKTHQTIKRVTDDIEERFHFNTAISAVMELVNQLYQFPVAGDADPFRLAAFREAIEMTVLLLSPMVPHICEELWQQMGHSPSIAHAAWPDFDPAVAAADEIEIVIQVNGKLRGKILVDAGATGDDIKARALACDQIRQWIDGKNITKVIVVLGKLVSVVAA